MTTKTMQSVMPTNANPAVSEAVVAGRWSVEQVRQWQARTGWLCGFNFLPSSAVNFIDMWHPATFDLETIDRELGWATDIGFNCLRTNLQFILWQDDAAGHKARLDAFLDCAHAHGLRVAFCLFDDCGFSGGRPDTNIQRNPIAGIHNSRAMASPGREMVMDQANWPLFADYVTDIVGTLGKDPRVVFWDIYNEPGNLMIFRETGQKEFSDALEPYSIALMRDAFEWARSVAPVQPMTAGGWHIPMPWESSDGGLYEHPIDQAAFALSDFISFHAYCEPNRMAEIIAQLELFDRPLVCTEWMARHIGSNIREQLPLLHREQVGAFQWGLVQGRTQTHIPWPGINATTEPGSLSNEVWFHDILDGDGKPYDPSEIDVIGQLSPRVYER